MISLTALVERFNKVKDLVLEEAPETLEEAAEVSDKVAKVLRNFAEFLKSQRATTAKANPKAMEKAIADLEECKAELERHVDKMKGVEMIGSLDWKSIFLPLLLKAIQEVLNQLTGGGE